MNKIVDYILHKFSLGLMYLGIWSLSKLFEHVDVYCSGKSPEGKVEGVTFTSNKEYLDHVGEFNKAGSTVFDKKGETDA